MKPFDQVIIRPLITEKAVIMKETLGRYCFEVARGASSQAIREALETFFNVKVKEIRTLPIYGKSRRVGRYTGLRPNGKKAIVTLAEGQKLDLFEAK